MHEYIDQLLIDGKAEEAIPLIEAVWKKEARTEEEMLADLSFRLDTLEKILRRA